MLPHKYPHLALRRCVCSDIPRSSHDLPCARTCFLLSLIEICAAMVLISLSSLNSAAAFANSSLQPVVCSQSQATIRSKKFMALVTLLFCCHLINALISEHLLAGTQIFKFPIFFTCFQCSGYILLALISRALLLSQSRCTPLRTYAAMGILQAISMASSVRCMTCDQLLQLVFSTHPTHTSPTLRLLACAT